MKCKKFNKMKFMSDKTGERHGRPFLLIETKRVTMAL